MLFALGARLHMSAARVERMSVREVSGWIDFFTEQAAASNDGAMDVSTLSRAQLRAMFNDGR
jgi:hypothetical protein